MKYLLAAMLVGATVVGANLATTTASAQGARQDYRNDVQDLDRDIQRERYEERTGHGPRARKYENRADEDCDAIRRDARRLGIQPDRRCR